MLSLYQGIDVIIHIDKYLINFLASYGIWTYLIVSMIILCETGLIITPFLPGDSLLFTLGTIAAQPGKPLNIIILFFLLTIASALGNQLNYLLGSIFSSKRNACKKSFFINQQHLSRAHVFYERHGGKTIILARFMPIIRTFVPFVAGMSYMQLTKFTNYNVLSAILWSGSLLGMGYFLGSLPVVKEHFNLVIYGIMFLSILPSLIALIYKRKRILC